MGGDGERTLAREGKEREREREMEREGWGGEGRPQRFEGRGVRVAFGEAPQHGCRVDGEAAPALSIHGAPWATHPPSSGAQRSHPSAGERKRGGGRHGRGVAPGPERRD